MQITLNLPDNLTEIDRSTLVQEVAIALFQQQHITLNQAADIVGISLTDFQQLLISRGVTVPQTTADDPDDEPEELILNSLCTSLQQIREGKVHPISELWNDIDV